MTNNQVFYFTFALAVGLEILRFVIPASSTVLLIFLVCLDYSLLGFLGFKLAKENNPYRTAIVKTWPFVIMWFVAGYLMVRFDISGTPPDWSAEKQRLAEWGYVLGSIVILPVSFLSSTIGVFLGRTYLRIVVGKSNAA